MVIVVQSDYLLPCLHVCVCVMVYVHFTGYTTYVLTEAPRNGVGYWLWNASSGHHFAQHEPYIPLKSVGCVIDQHNVSE